MKKTDVINRLKANPEDKQAYRAFLSFRDRFEDPPPCKYGHDGCSIVDGGPCEAELFYSYYSDDPEFGGGLTFEINISRDQLNQAPEYW